MNAGWDVSLGSFFPSGMKGSKDIQEQATVTAWPSAQM